MKREITQVIERITSRDGTTIGYQSFGSGPGLILVQGAMGTTENYRQLALLLANQFTVHLPDRRGRGMSPRPYDAKHSISDDVEDLRCVLEHTRSSYLFGLSSGAMIVLEGLRSGLRVERAAVFEPPFYLNGMSARKIQRFNMQVERKQLATALVTAMEIMRLGPPFVRFVPRWLLQVGTALVLRADSRRSTPYARLSELIPAMRYDLNVVYRMNQHLNDLQSVNTPVMLMGGNRSPDYLKAALLALKTRLPIVESVELVDADHSAPWNDDLNGRPAQVGRALSSFFVVG